MSGSLEQLAASGVLRAAINTGNRALVQPGPGGTLNGVSPDLARRLAERIGARLDCVVFDGAGKVFKAATKGAWDVAFLAIDPTRAGTLTFTRPYITIEATYAVRTSSPIASVAEADQPGTRILVAKGSAYDLYLTDTLNHASILRAATPLESMEAFRCGEADLVGGVRESLEDSLGDDPQIRILPDAFRKVEQAMALPGAGHPCFAALDAFVAEAISSGFVAERSR